MRRRIGVVLLVLLLLGAAVGGTMFLRSGSSAQGEQADRPARGMGLFSLFRRRAASQVPAAAAWQTDLVRRDTLRPQFSATGQVKAAHSTILIWQTSGLVARIAQVGQQVKAGETVAELDPNTWSQPLLSAQAQLLQLEQQWEQLRIVGEAQAWNNYAQALYQEDRAKQNLETIYEKIADGEAVSDITVERYESAYALAQKQREYAEKVYQQWKQGRAPELTQLEAQMQALKAQLATAYLTAPFDATVTQVFTDVGTWVQPGMQALRLDDLSVLYVEVALNEFDAPHVHPDLQVQFTFDGIPYTTFHGVVEQVSPVAIVDPASGVTQFTVRIRMTDADERVRPGMTAAVTIYGDEVTDALLVPTRAIRVVEGQPTVYVLRNGVPTPVAVKVGLSADVYTQILEGDVKEGERVVLNPPSASPFGP